MSSPSPTARRSRLGITIAVLSLALVAVIVWIVVMLLDDGGSRTAEPEPTRAPTTASSSPAPDPTTPPPPPASPADEPSTTAPAPTAPAPAATATPTTPATPTAAATTAPASPPAGEGDPAPEPTAEETFGWQGSASFDHFSVELLEDSGDGAQVEGKAALPVEVCVTRALTPGSPTRVSLDPWSLETSTGDVQRPQTPGSYDPPFPGEVMLAEGECASGYLTFDMVTEDVDWAQLVYANGLGDRAVWQFH